MQRRTVERCGIAALFLLGVGAATTEAQAASLRCKGGDINDGDPVHVLRSRCGAPEFVERRTTLETFVAQTATGEARVVYREAGRELWTYAQDDANIRIVTIHRGVVMKVEHVRATPIEEASCARGTVPDGAYTAEVYMACGQPIDRRRKVETRSHRINDIEHRELVTVERWLYAPGPGNTPRVLEFENGALKAVTSG
ncbi:MAG: DUF2845 domain-containing protein [Deltaproteobacteria bacterium]|nr:DUF2845 domain-containing protein [Deltaproteobacteria bacterium]